MADTHTGHAILRTTKGRVTILCPFGHLYHSFPASEWAGSHWEMLFGWREAIVTCEGTLPSPRTTG